MNRRSFLALGGASLATAALASCAGPSTGSGSSSSSAATDWTSVTPADSISWLSSHPGKSEEAEKQIIEAFEAETGIKVELITGGANYEEVAAKFQTQQAGTEISDIVVASDVWWFRFAINDQVIPLTPDLLSAAGNDTSEYHTTLFDDYLYGDDHWAVPFARSTPLFYYNKAHLAAAGLPDRAPETWEEFFEEWVAPLKSANASTSGYLQPYQYPALDGYAGWTFQNLLWGRGTGWSDGWTITCADDAAIAAMQQVQDSIAKDGAAGVSSKNAIADLVAGAVSATVSSTGDLVGALSSAKENGIELGVGFLPGGPKATTGVCPTGGAGLVIAKKTSPERQLAAAKFVSFATNADNAALFSKATGYMPVRTTADMSDVLSSTPQIEVAINQLKVTKSQDYGRVFLPGADQEMAKSCAQLMNEGADVATTMQALKDTLETIYKRDVEPKLK
ncbi:extracellular solute-binding protein [Brooklawnia cerclae]|uniref:Sn-glycerol 3-phosphate transport system substrate-binding protein n=1 Tax=Brooklawnia cerclae TaxID=349934 RepID=A0ABX0SDJ3_9ACTN|nr:extracellular solute-binding protein [Brooklawnia cerclae]NIH56464.1 sn-glycerol 3-phosphate transport system substrate-binding protein [Brooklawnia cerclae]